MASIPETELERLKNEVSVQRLVEASGIELKKAGKDWMGRCPLHEDETASLVVTPAKNLWHCFGCGEGGGPIDWVMKLRGVSFRHAVELLREGVTSSSAAEDGGTGRAPVRGTVKTLPAPVQLDADDQALLNQTVGYYHERLLGNPEALAYLQARGLAHPELVAHFKLGLADRSLGLRLPDKTRKAGADIRARLQRIGLYRESGHEHFTGSLIVPVRDEAGHVVEVYGRKLLDNLRAGTPKHLYLPAREGRGRGVFNIAALTASKEIILCEALIDALTFWCAGYRNVTSSYGIEGFTAEHVAAFKRCGTERVLIAYDRDEAGERGAAKVAEALMAQGIECFRVQFPKGMDANEYALKVQPASKSLGLLIRKAVWLGKGAAPAQPVAEPTDMPMQASMAAEKSKPAPVAIASPSAADPAPVEPLPASPMPLSARELPLTVKDGEHGREATLTLGEGKDARRWRVRGLAKNLGVDVLKVNLMVSHGDSFHVDTLDLYAAKARGHYVSAAAAETGLDERVLKADLGRLLLAMEQLQDETIAQALAPAPAPQMDPAEQAAALALLKSPDLIERIGADYAACGLVGEATNKLVGYLAAVSRKLARPLGVVIQSSSAAGKSSLMDAVLAFVPEEEKVKYSAMTGQSLFYMGETNLKHKALAIVEEEGASRASYALKLLQSEGELTIASTGKDPTSGNLITQQYRVQGPVALFFTTTARDLDEELMNRCLVLAVDEGREQTRAIHERQRARRTLDGLLANRHKTDLITLHQNAQRLLRPLDVLNPYAQFLSFPDQTTRLRRDHEKYLTLIDVIAFVHQHQRAVKTAARGDDKEGQRIEYIEVQLTDIALANRIAHDVLGRSLDELPPQTRRLLTLVDGYVGAESARQQIKRAELRFSRRSLREAIHWGDTQLKTHLARLAELEYLVAHRTRTGGFEYELVYELAGTGGDAGGATGGATGSATGGLRFPGLADIDALQCAYDAARSGSDEVRSGSGRPVVGARSAGGRGDASAGKPVSMRVALEEVGAEAPTQSSVPMHPHPSYPQGGAASLAACLAAGA
ncbi:CHC2 zinc finger domain-containing protein [Roseateles sp.]|uniref:CHC2 zinc finger domain-containing protein n=1 Tax=Roseateles sp. TaxID=1971397 RepID=UPI0032669D8F